MESMRMPTPEPTEVNFQHVYETQRRTIHKLTDENIMYQAELAQAYQVQQELREQNGQMAGLLIKQGGDNGNGGASAESGLHPEGGFPQS
jgi:hypothetical protein